MCDRREDQRVFGPTHDVKVNGIALAGTGAPTARNERAATCRVDAVTIAVQPLAHFLESRDLSRLNAAVSHRPDIQQVIAITADHSHKRLDTLPK